MCSNCNQIVIGLEIALLTQTQNNAQAIAPATEPSPDFHEELYNLLKSGLAQEYNAQWKTTAAMWIDLLFFKNFLSVEMLKNESALLKISAIPIEFLTVLAACYYNRFIKMLDDGCDFKNVESALEKLLMQSTFNSLPASKNLKLLLYSLKIQGPYQVRDAAGIEYGPVHVYTLLKWLLEKRITPVTHVRFYSDMPALQSFSAYGPINTNLQLSALHSVGT
jgi:hypothetical protein